MSSKILLVGSLAFDVIFSIPEDFRKSIPLENGEIRNFNASYVADSKHEFPGGNAGNIAFWLGKEGVKNTIFSAWGKDFEQKDYKSRLDTFSDIRGKKGDFTAHAYMVSDPLHQQLIIWQPNAYEQNELQSLLEYFSKEEIENFEYAVFSAGTPNSILKHLQEFRKINKNAKVLFDPGQVTPIFSAEVFAKCCEISDILIGNDIEFQHFFHFGIPKNILSIETKGEKGVSVKKTQHSEKEDFCAVKVRKVVETTGAGDAFRAGFLAELSKGNSFENSIQRGMELGAKCVTLSSGQESL